MLVTRITHKRMSDLGLNELSVASCGRGGGGWRGRSADPRGDAAWDAVSARGGGGRARGAGAEGRVAWPVPYLAIHAAVGAAARSTCRRAVTEVAERASWRSQRNEALLAEISQINLELLRRRALE